MGGASSQVTVQLKGAAARERADPSTTYTLDVGGHKYVLYTHSYLGFGQEQARSRYNALLTGPAREDPCFNKGYNMPARAAGDGDKRYDQYAGRPQGDFTGGGNFSACSDAVDELFTQVDPALKLAATCARPPCAFGGVHQPRFWEGGDTASSMVLFENFFHTSNALGMPSGPSASVSLADFEALGSKWCALDWSFVEQTGDGARPRTAHTPRWRTRRRRKCASPWPLSPPSSAT